MLPHLRFLLDVMARSGFKELNKLSEGELVASQGIAEMLASGEAHCLLQFRELGNSGAKVPSRGRW
ncbi:unnamed protein product [Cladocopium goreaui]|uniref:Uncharacterized protein n=1 Tax=Cladocopium goreaui TaxID=2562237 RepID=A0A9P1BQ87_9DINO|nr:unnamed protein product [Cladocopium goreaui]